MRASRLICLVVIFCLWAVGTHAAVRLSAEERAWLDANPDKLVLWFDQNYPPIEFLSAENTFAGMGADVMGLIEDRLGVAFHKIPSSDWDRQLLSLENGESAIAPAIVETKDRARFAFFSAPYITIPAVIITTQGNDAFFSLEDLAGHRVAVVRGFVSEDFVRREYGDRLRLVLVKNVQEGLRAVSFGVVDAMVENLAVAAFHIDREKLPNLKVSGTTPLAYSQSFAVSRKYPLLFSAMQKAMADIPQAELIDIERKWISLHENTMSPEMRMALRFAVVFVLALILSLAGMSWLLGRRLDEKRAQLGRTEATLREKVERLNMAFEASSDGLWDWNIPTGAMFYSPRFFTMLGYAPEEFPPSLESWRSLVHADDITRVEQALTGRLVRSETYKEEFRMRSKSGEWRWILSRGKVVERDVDGAPTRAVGTHVDITERKKSEAALRESEEKYRDIFNNTPNGIFRSTFGGRLVEANPSMARMLGFDSREELLAAMGNLATDLYPRPEGRQDLLDALLESPRGVSREVEFRRKDGERLFAIINASLQFNGNGEPLFLVGTLEDITERKRAELALRQSEDKFSRLFRLSPDAIVVQDFVSRRIKDVNEAFLRLFGFSLEECLGRTPSELNVYQDESVCDNLFAQVEGLGVVENFEAEVRRKNGDILSCSISCQMLVIDGVPHMMGVMRDVTESRKMQQMMIQTEKMLSVGGIAAGIAHEINNPLGIILNTAQNLAQRTKPDFPRNLEVAGRIGLDLGLLDAYMRERGLHSFIEEISAAAIRAAAIIRHMLDFSRTSESRRAPCHIPVIIDKAVELASSDYDLKKNYDFRLVTVIKEYGADLPLVDCTETEIEQVLLNLLRNAGQAMASSPVPEPCIRIRATHEGDHVRVAVEDNGPGMSPEIQKRVFEPFFTTKKAGVGTGLGLSVSYFIITSGHGGRMYVDSVPGQKTTFTIELPVVAARSARREDARSDHDRR